MHKDSDRGFTLTELIITMVIVAALAAVSIPLFFNVQTFQDRGFHDTVLSAVRYAQKHAVATGCAVQVNVTVTGFTLSRDASVATCNGGAYGTALADPSGAQPNFSRTVPTGVTLTSVPATFVFCPLGDTSTTGICTGNYTNVDVTLNIGGRLVTVWGSTGFVQRQ